MRATLKHLSVERNRLKSGTCGLLVVHIWGDILGHAVHSLCIKEHIVQIYKGNLYVLLVSGRSPRPMDLMFCITISSVKLNYLRTSCDCFMGTQTALVEGTPSEHYLRAFLHSKNVSYHAYGHAVTSHSGMIGYHHCSFARLQIARSQHYLYKDTRTTTF